MGSPADPPPTTPRAAAPALRPTVDHAAAMDRKRRAARLTFALPLAGCVIAALSAVWIPVGLRELVLLVAMYVWVTIGVEVGFHRLLAHRAFQVRPWLRKALWFSGQMAAQGSAIHWIAQHRRHHAHSDTDQDPHSPVVAASARGKGWRADLAGLWHAHQAHTWRDAPTNVLLFAGDLLRDPQARRMERLQPVAVTTGLLVPAVVGGLLSADLAGAWNGFLWGGPVRIALQHQLFFTNASLAHRYGGRLFDTADHSRNNAWCAPWTFGSALQNTHHAFPASPCLAQRWFEIDIAGALIRLMAQAGLAWDLRTPTAQQVAARRLPT